MKFAEKQRLQAEERRERRMQRLGGNCQCTLCPETDPICLTRVKHGGHEGRVLCQRCRAETAPAPSRYKGPQSAGPTLACHLCPYDSRIAPLGARVIERHHPLGRAHYPSFTVPVCLNCHARLSEWQRKIGTDLKVQSSRIETVGAAISSAAAYVLGVNACTRAASAPFQAKHILLASLSSLAGLYEIATCETKR
jgi:hypothetical protein